MKTSFKEHYQAIKSRSQKADVESLYAIIDRLLSRIEELEALLERQ